MLILVLGVDVCSARGHIAFLRALIEEIMKHQDGVLVDLGPNGVAWLIICPIVFLADMPEANAACNVSAPGANLFCRDCEITKENIGQETALHLQRHARTHFALYRALEEAARSRNRTAMCVFSLF